MIAGRKRFIEHFSQIAPFYRNLRTLDPEPIYRIKDFLFRYDSVENSKLNVLDVGAGTGRYTELFAKLIGLERVNLFASDASYNMLLTASGYLSKYQTVLVNSIAESLPFKDESFNVILTFNAIHHFDFDLFMFEVSRVLKTGGFLFIYTRTQEQNRRTIWGKFFPGFVEKEKRLFYKKDIVRRLTELEGFDLIYMEEFKYKRCSTLEELMTKVFARHYSTFYLYTDEELKRSAEVFQKRIVDNFGDLNKIEHIAENILFVLKKKELEA